MSHTYQPKCFTCGEPAAHAAIISNAEGGFDHVRFYCVAHFRHTRITRSIEPRTILHTSLTKLAALLVAAPGE
jgi:hypothetical protein